MSKLISYLILIAAVIYGALFFLPGIIFKHKIEYKNIVVYSQSPMHDNIHSVLAEVYGKISGAEIFKPEARHKILICKSFGYYAFFAPFAKKSFGVSYPWFDRSYIAGVDIENNKAFSNRPSDNRRNLDGLMAHEIAHDMMENHLGSIRYRFLQEWKEEGYAEYVAGSGTFNEPSMICDPKLEESPAMKYLKYRLVMEQLMKEERMRFKDLYESSDVYEYTLKGIKAKLCGVSLNLKERGRILI